jgi:hypothetical protein
MVGFLASVCAVALVNVGGSVAIVDLRVALDDEGVGVEERIGR